jgi:preprotein translocase subunit SecD
MPEKVRTLRLVADRGTAEQVERTVRILNVRLAGAKITGWAKLSPDGAIEVTLPDEEELIGRAIDLLLAGGNLMFYGLITDDLMPREEQDRLIALIDKEKDRGAFDDAKAKYDVISDRETARKYLVELPGVAGYLLESVTPGRFQDSPALFYELVAEAARENEELTRRLDGRKEAVVFDGELILSPVVKGVIGKSGVIFNLPEDMNLEDTATILRSGRLPVDVSLESPGGDGESD